MNEQFTRYPNFLLEWQAKLPPEQFSILTALVRKTCGWDKVKDTVSTSQLVKMTGMQERRVQRQMKRLLASGVPVRVTGRSKNGTNYRLIIENVDGMYSDAGIGTEGHSDVAAAREPSVPTLTSPTTVPSVEGTLLGTSSVKEIPYPGSDAVRKPSPGATASGGDDVAYLIQHFSGRLNSQEAKDLLGYGLSAGDLLGHVTPAPSKVNAPYKYLLKIAQLHGHGSRHTQPTPPPIARHPLPSISNSGTLLATIVGHGLAGIPESNVAPSDRDFVERQIANGMLKRVIYQDGPKFCYIPQDRYLGRLEENVGCKQIRPRFGQRMLCDPPPKQSTPTGPMKHSPGSSAPARWSPQRSGPGITNGHAFEVLIRYRKPLMPRRSARIDHLYSPKVTHTENRFARGQAP